MTTQQPSPRSVGGEKTYASSVSSYVPQDPENRRNALGGLIVGGAIGLLIGWFLFGWLLFPVRFQGNVDGLTPESQADYISSVADAYVARQDDAALRLATYRLRTFIGSDTLDEALLETVTYYRENQAPASDAFPLPVEFNSAVRINNIYDLATDMNNALNVDLDEFLRTASIAPADSASAPADSASAPAVEQNPAPTEPAEESDAGMNALVRLLQILAAIALVAGGVWLLRRVFRRDDRRAPQEPEIEAFEEDDIILPGSLQASGIGAPTLVRPATQRIVYDRPGEEIDGDDDDIDVAIYLDDDFDEHGEPPTTLGAQVDPEAYAGYGFQDGPADETVDGEYRSIQEPGASYGATQVGQYGDPEQTETAQTEMVPGPRTTGNTRQVGGSFIGEYVFNYPADIDAHEYDESYTILDQQGRVIGDCGMGVNLSHGTLKNDPNRVIALDSWLFDKVDPQRPDDYRRTLISEYVVDHQMEKIFTDDPSAAGPPIVAQPGTEYRLEGHNLILFCTILEAEYGKSGSNAGLFQKVSVRMRILLKD